MIALWWMGCGGMAPAEAPPVVAVELAWPGVPLDAVDATLAPDLDDALAPLAGARRCEATAGHVRCLVEAPLPAVQQAVSTKAWPDGVGEPVVRPLLPPSEHGAVLVLDAVPAAWTWNPEVWLHRRWPVAQVVSPAPLPDGATADRLGDLGAAVRPVGTARCDGAAATALWVGALPQVPPPDGVAVRTWRPEQGVYVEGPGPWPVGLDAPWCSVVHDGRVEGIVGLPPAEASAKLPGLDIVPLRSWRRIYRSATTSPTDADALRSRPDVWAVRVVQDVVVPSSEWVVDAEALRQHRVDRSALAVLSGARSVAVGGVRLGVVVDEAFGADTTLPTEDGDRVPLSAVAQRQAAEIERVRVRVNGTRGRWVEVLIDGPDSGDAVDTAARALGLEPLGPWERRRHLP